MNPKELDYEREWSAGDSWGYNVAVKFELRIRTPIISFFKVGLFLVFK
jgi:hypothetical protein